MDDDEAARAFERRYGFSFPSISDPRRRISRELGLQYQPAVVLLDAEGRIVGRHVGRGGPVAWDRLAAEL